MAFRHNQQMPWHFVRIAQNNQRQLIFFQDTVFRITKWANIVIGCITHIYYSTLSSPAAGSYSCTSALFGRVKLSPNARTVTTVVAMKPVLTPLTTASLRIRVISRLISGLSFVFGSALAVPRLWALA